MLPIAIIEGDRSIIEIATQECAGERIRA